MFWDTQQHNNFHGHASQDFQSSYHQFEEQPSEAGFWDDHVPAPQFAHQKKHQETKGFWDDDFIDTTYKIQEEGKKQLTLVDQLVAGGKQIYVKPSVFDQQVMDAVKKGQRFIDRTFPADPKSIGNVKGISHLPIAWMKLSDCFKQITIFNNIEPNDIWQQSLGDCYFLAGISAIAEFPERIKNLFVEHKVNDSFYFKVKILYKGIWRVINLDQLVPARKDIRKPVFCSSKSNEVWPILLQKAWAKLYKSYARTQGGYLYQALRNLTGAPVVDFNLGTIKPQQFFAKVKDFDQRDYVMLASSKSGSDTTTNKINISMGHAYTLIGVYEAVGYKILKLRNPWGKGQATGLFRDDHPIWDSVSSQQKQKMGYVKAQDGIFFITIEDFYSSFSSVTVAMVNDSYSYITCRQDGNFKNGSYFKIKIQQKGSYNFQFEQTPFRSFQNPFQYKHNDLTLIVGKIEGDSVKYMEGIYLRHQWVEKTYQLQPGFYFAYLKDNNINKMETDARFTLSIYAQYSSCKIQPSNKKQSGHLLRKFIQQGALKVGRRQPIGGGRQFIQAMLPEGYTVFMLVNKSGSPLRLKIESDPQPWWHFKYQFKGQNDIVVQAGAGMNAMAVARQRESAYRGVNIKGIKLI